MLTNEDVLNVLSDKQRTEDVVRAAARALNTLETADSETFPDDGAKLVGAKTTLRSAFTDLSGLEED